MVRVYFDVLVGDLLLFEGEPGALDESGWEDGLAMDLTGKIGRRDVKGNTVWMIDFREQ